MVLSLATVAFAQSKHGETLAYDILHYVRDKVKEAKEDFYGDVEKWNLYVSNNGKAVQTVVRDKLEKVAGILKKAGDRFQNYLYAAIEDMPHQTAISKVLDDGFTFARNNYEMIKTNLNNVVNHLADGIFYVFGLTGAPK